MKLRIQGNSLRLRLTRTDVRVLHDQGRVTSSIEFADGGCSLIYSLEASKDVSQIGAQFNGQFIRVRLPEEVMKAWTESDEVSLQAPPLSIPSVLVEKDFQCLHQTTAQNADAYENPRESVHLCS